MADGLTAAPCRVRDGPTRSKGRTAVTTSAEPRRQTDSGAHDATRSALGAMSPGRRGSDIGNRPCHSRPSFPTVLILEDEAAVRRSLARYLHASGYAVKEASDVDQAFAALQRGGFQAVILDVGVPDPTGLGRTGLEVLAHLHEGGRSVPLCVIVFTGYPLTEAQEGLISRCRARIVYKPETYETLLRCLEEPTGAA